MFDILINMKKEQIQIKLGPKRILKQQDIIPYGSPYQNKKQGVHITNSIVQFRYKLENQYTATLPRIQTILTFYSPQNMEIYYQNIKIHANQKSSFIQQYDNIFRYNTLPPKYGYRFCVVSQAYRFTLEDLIKHPFIQLSQNNELIPFSMGLFVGKNLLQAYHYILDLLKRMPFKSVQKLKYEINLNRILVLRDYQIVLGFPLIPSTNDTSPILVKQGVIRTDYRNQIKQCLVSLKKLNSEFFNQLFSEDNQKTQIQIQEEIKNIKKWLQKIYNKRPELKQMTFDKETFFYLKSYQQTIPALTNKKMIEMDNMLFSKIESYNQSQIEETGSSQQQQHINN